MPPADHTLRPQFSLADRLQQDQLPVSACYQCRKCSSGCPLTFAMDLLPDQVIRLALLGQEEELFQAHTPWVCSSCETCTTRCPNGIDIAAVMDWLKQEALKRRAPLAEPQVAAFHHTFLQTIRLSGGRLSEPLLLGLYTLKNPRLLHKLRSGDLADELRLAWQLARRGRLRLKLPKKLRHPAEIRQIFKDNP